MLPLLSWSSRATSSVPELMRAPPKHGPATAQDLMQPKKAALRSSRRTITWPIGGCRAIVSALRTSGATDGIQLPVVTSPSMTIHVGNSRDWRTKAFEIRRRCRFRASIPAGQTRMRPPISWALPPDREAIRGGDRSVSVHDVRPSCQNLDIMVFFEIQSLRTPNRRTMSLGGIRVVFKRA